MSGSATRQAHVDEYARLRRLCATLAEIVGPEGWPALDEVDDSLKTDHELQAMTSLIRARYLRGLAEWTARRWRTPPTGAAIPFPGTNDTYAYAYDRQHPPQLLEQRLVCDAHAGAVLCSSGMAALNVVFLALGHLLDRRRELVALASYFETLTLLRVGTFAERWTRVRTEAELLEQLERPEVGVILIEPVRYDWALGTSTWTELLEALACRDEPPVVILDTSLSGACSAQDQLLERLRASVALVVRVRSGIKLDQRGLELTNLGVIEWFCKDARLEGRLGSVLSACRVVSGATLTWPDACALAPELVFGCASLRDYSAGVFASNRQLYDALRDVRGLFASVTHPAPPWPAPFVLLELADGGAENYRLLAALLAEEQGRRGLRWRMSGSFGFRTARYETILPEEQGRPGEVPAGVLKIAAGRYPGARLAAIVELVEELSTYTDLDATRRAWTRRHHSFEVKQ